MSKGFHLIIYNRIRGGEKVESFEKWMFNKLPPKSMQELNTPYYKVRDLLVRDFRNGDIPYTMSWSVRKYLNWLFEHGRIDVGSSSCTPHCRQLDNLILYYDGTLRNIKTQNSVINPTLNEEGYATFGGKLIHRLMAKAWFKNPDPDEYTEVNHKDKNRSNNNIENLELTDHENNILHRDGKPYWAAPRYYTPCGMSF
tara:strand:+ start:513 stop:1106 length:594 start_codon:yes stop_codon:yes gene_type:complete